VLQGATLLTNGNGVLPLTALPSAARVAVVGPNGGGCPADLTQGCSARGNIVGAYSPYRVSGSNGGVGVATLANMKALPVSELKIDRSFIRTLPGTAQDRMMVQTMLALSKQLNVRMIAVGVENITQWAWLNEHHCDGAQGWLIGKAVGTEEFPELVGKIRQNKFPATSARVAL
jgi:hypothetical protein